jgi:hypothetical protein
MKVNSMSDLQALKVSILEDGVVDDDEVLKLKAEIFEDGKVDREEADVLFEINDTVSGKANSTGWPALFVEAITAHVLGDDASPGAVDADEAAWLKAKIEGDGGVDATEKALLENLKTKAQGEIPESLHALFAAHLN